MEESFLNYLHKDFPTYGYDSKILDIHSRPWLLKTAWILNHLGHISSETTIDIYSHVTNTMRQQAAVKKDRQISGIEAEIPRDKELTRIDTTPPDFKPYKPKCRKSGTGCGR